MAVRAILRRGLGGALLSVLLVASPVARAHADEDQRIAELADTLGPKHTERERIAAVTALARLGSKATLKPLVAALSRKGASLPVLLTYLVSMSTLSLVRLPIEWALLGARLTLLRIGASFLLPPLVGAAALLLLRFAR